MVSHIGSPLSIMLLNWACVDKKEGLRSSRVYGRVSEWPCRLRSLIRDGKGGWWEVLLMPPALAARVSHTAVCENGLSFILNGPSQEAWFFFFFFHHRSQTAYPRQGPKILSPSEWWNGCQHIPLSSSPLPCAQQEPKCQGVNPVSTILAYGGEVADDFITLLLALCETSPVVSPGSEWACIYCCAG